MTCPRCTDPTPTEMFETRATKLLPHDICHLAHLRLRGAEITPEARRWLVKMRAGIDVLLSGEEFEEYGEYLEARQARERER